MNLLLKNKYGLVEEHNVRFQLGIGSLFLCFLVNSSLDIQYFI